MPSCSSYASVATMAAGVLVPHRLSAVSLQQPPTVPLSPLCSVLPAVCGGAVAPSAPSSSRLCCCRASSAPSPPPDCCLPPPCRHSLVFRPSCRLQRLITLRHPLRYSTAPNFPSAPSIKDSSTPVEGAPLAPLLSPNVRSVLSSPLSSLLTSSSSVANSPLPPSLLSALPPSVLYTSCGARRCEGFAGGVCPAVQKCP